MDPLLFLFWFVTYFTVTALAKNTSFYCTWDGPPPREALNIVMGTCVFSLLHTFWASRSRCRLAYWHWPVTSFFFHLLRQRKIHSFASFVGALFMIVFWDAPDPIKIVDSKQGWKKWQTSMKIKMLKQENVQKMTLKNCNVHSVLLFFPEKVSNEVSKCMTILDQTLSHSKFHTNLSINVKTKKHQFLPYNSMGPVKKFFLNKKICSPNRSVKSPSIWP